MRMISRVVIVSLLLSTTLHTAPAQSALKTIYSCENSVANISCPKGEVIKVKRANYGRLSPEPCNDSNDPVGNWDIQCVSTTAVGIVANLCENQRVCRVPARNSFFTGDPCPNTPKYLRVVFMCESTSTTLPTTTARATPPTPNPTDHHQRTTTTTTSTTARSTTTSDHHSTIITTITPKDTTNTTPPDGGSGGSNDGDDPLVPEPIVDKSLCPAIHVRNITWPPTEVNTEAVQPCPNNQQGRAYWYCDVGKEWRGRPDLSDCTSPQTQVVQHMVNEQQSSREIASAMVRAGTEDVLYGGDVIILTETMNQMHDFIEMEVSEIGEIQAAEVVQEVNQQVVKTGSMLLDKNHEESWMDLPQATQARSATQLVEAVESSALQVAAAREAAIKAAAHRPSPDYMHPEEGQEMGDGAAWDEEENLQEPIVNVEINIRVEVSVIDTSTESGAALQDYKYPYIAPVSTYDDWAGQSDDTITIPAAAVRQYGHEGLAKLIFIAYKNLGNFLHSTDIDEMQSDQPQEEQPRSDANTDTQPDPRYDDPPLRTESKHEANTKIKTSFDEQQDQPTLRTYNNPEKSAADPNKGNKKEEGKQKKEQFVNSNVISATINERTQKLPLQEPMLYTLAHHDLTNIYNPTCSFWEYSHRGIDGRWSDFGCRVVDTNTTHTTCSCNHLTNFAILMDVVGTELSQIHLNALTAITCVGCIISIVCLFLCFLTFTLIKNIQCERNTIHKNLVLTLMIAEIIFLAGIAETSRPILCSVIAALLHYFFLCAFAWMCLEGVQLYVLLVEVFESERSNMLYYYAAAYGLPAGIVGISAAIDHTGYGTESYCWLKTEDGFIWAFVAPVALVITVNIVMLSIAIYVMCKHASSASTHKLKDRSKMDKIRSWIKGASVLVILLGLTWALGLLYVSEHTLTMAYAFTVVNSLQGMLIFLFHCLLNEKIQKEYKRTVRHTSWLPEWFRVKYGGAKAYSSSSPNSTGSTGNYLQKLLSGRRRKRSASSTSRWNFWNKEPTSGSSQTSSSPMPASPPPVPEFEPLAGTTSNDYTEDPGGYLEPVGTEINAPYCDIDDLPTMSNIEGSMVDSDFLMGKVSTPINVDKYKISPGGENYYSSIHTLPEEDEDTDATTKNGDTVDGEKPACNKNLLQQLNAETSPPLPLCDVVSHGGGGDGGKSNAVVSRHNSTATTASARDSNSSSGISGSIPDINHPQVCNSLTKLNQLNEKHHQLADGHHMCLSTPNVSAVYSEHDYIIVPSQHVGDKKFGLSMPLLNARHTLPSDNVLVKNK